jgi:thiamine-phosphate pyrophosphorylase
MSVPAGMLRLIAVTGEPGSQPEEIQRWARAAVTGGASCVQLRSRHASSALLLEIARALVDSLSVPVLVNDRVDIALMAGAAGVHLGPTDLPVERARAIAPAGFIIGASVGNDDELGGARGADYVGVGPVFGTISKADAGEAIGPAEMARLIRASGCPGVGIGGITAANAGEVVAAGADGVAVLSALATDPSGAARAILAAIGT